MNIAILASGGDGAGMNACLYRLVKKLRGKNKIYLLARGYSGLIEGSCYDYGYDYIHSHKFDGGVMIKTARCPKFRTKEGLREAMETYRKLNLDALVVLGGNGSLRGANELSKLGANILFVPCTIDNDVFGSEYCIGFDTACKNCVDFIENVNATMNSFDRVCIYETMGRDCPAIAERVSELVDVDYLFVSKENTIEDCVKRIGEKRKEKDAPVVVLRENLIDAKELQNAISSTLECEAKVCVIGYLQRGGKPTKQEIKNAYMFADKICENIHKKEKNKIIMVKNGEFVSEDIVKVVQ